MLNLEAKEKYDVILLTLAEAISAKNDKIALQEWQLADLKNKLSEAERAAAEAKARDCGKLCKRQIERRGK